ncbi:uncharacterized protein LOC129590283 [Paramacrobiotus metropolitanus]|uniref:uncharacterized protein LOC129590283 n=1 Tax=Paramacrobiotus metropolitanus TaxID=2943436 RepID=UPI002445C03C|nr:uncharacterized protein LOC129590283 [Paramacrobiotus metropolitanus]
MYITPVSSGDSCQSESAINSKAAGAVPKGHDESLSPGQIRVSRRTEIDDTYSSKTDTLHAAEESLRRLRALEDAVNKASKIVPLRVFPTRTARAGKRSEAFCIPQSPLGRLHKVQRLLNNSMQEYTLAVFAEQAKFHKAAAKLFQARFLLISENPNPEAITMDSNWEDNILCHYWLKILFQNDQLRNMIQKHDITPLSYLNDIRCVHENTGFVLEFYFSPNPCFVNSVLRKSYCLGNDLPSERPELSLSAFVLSCSGSEICWTSEFLKKQADRRVASFFRFFTPCVTSRQQIRSCKDSDQSALTAILLADFEIGQLLRMDVIPNAIHIFDEWRCQAEFARNHDYCDRVTLLINRSKTAVDKLKRPKSKLRAKGSKKSVNDEVNLHVRLALKKAGYKVRHGRAYPAGDGTTSGDSTTDSHSAADGDDDHTAARKSFRGLLETNTVPRHRKHRGIRLKELRAVADQPDSGDDVAALFDLQSESESGSLASLLDADNEVHLPTKITKKAAPKATLKTKKPPDK